MKDKLTLAAKVVAVLALPVTTLAAIVVVVAWWRGWSPARPWRMVLGAWIMVAATWVLGYSPLAMWHEAYEQAAAGHTWWALLPLSPMIVGLGVTAGALVWARRWQTARNGMIRSPRRAGTWAHRQWSHAMARARAEARRPGLVPTLTRKGDPVLGRAAVITEGAAGRLVPTDPRLLTLPMDALNRHVVVVGEPGAGKTVALLRLMRTWLEGAWLRHVQDGGDRPLLIFVDCKGGHDGRATAEKFRRMCLGLRLARGRIGLWPSEVRLDLWCLPPQRLVEVLVEMVRAAHPFYDAMRDELVALAVLAPCGPPADSVEFVRRLNSEWLLKAWGPEHPGERESIRENAKHFAGIASQYRGLFRRIGRLMDAGRHISDFDALCLTLEGTENQRTASAQAQALVELITDLAARGDMDGRRRRVLLCFDEFSAVSDSVIVSVLMERARSLGVAVIPAAQSWSGLGPTDDERARLIAAAAGGVLLLGTNDPEKIAERGGTGIVVEAGTKRMEDGGWGDEGTGRAQRGMVVDPDWVRALGRHPGQVVYIHQGRAVWGVVAPTEVTDGARALLPEPMLRAIESHRFSITTRGNRVPIAELEAGLSHLEENARLNGDEAADAGSFNPERDGS